ncbi:MAG: hypothetical protein M0R51_16900 [Clostridia bacterium]|jgi:hypothetical protein|nr:hypothetical protein [Clostridia bacterium]
MTKVFDQQEIEALKHGKKYTVVTEYADGELFVYRLGKDSMKILTHGGKWDSLLFDVHIENGEEY